MRDITVVPLTAEQSLVIACDNIGGVGQKEDDVVFSDYATVAYFGFRVAMMECLAVGGVPIAGFIQNFVSDDAWPILEKGFHIVCDELKVGRIPLSGSTESNFKLVQSAVGMSIVATVDREIMRINATPNYANMAVIGHPLWGEEVLEKLDDILPLSLFRSMLEWEGIFEILPVGSKGIEEEVRTVFHPIFDGETIRSKLDLHKSAGPSTCVVISYDPACEHDIRIKAGHLFSRLTIKD